MEHAGEAGIWRRILPLELSGADCGTLGSAKVGWRVFMDAHVGGGDFIDGVPAQEHGFLSADSDAIEERGVPFSETGMERGEIERSDSSDNDAEFDEIDSTVIFDVVEASELFRENGGGCGISETAGDCIFLRKSVYADGGVIGVLTPSSILILWNAGKAERGVRAERALSSPEKVLDGNSYLVGVWSWASFGRAECGRVAVAILAVGSCSV